MVETDFIGFIGEKLTNVVIKRINGEVKKVILSFGEEAITVESIDILNSSP